MPKILVTPIELAMGPSAAVDVLRNAGVEVVFPTPGSNVRDQDQLIQQLQGIDGVLASVEPYTPRVLAAAKLRAIARAGVGYDSVDIEAASANDVIVTITPGTNHDSVSEHALALLLGVFRGFPFRDQQVRTGNWTRKSLWRLTGRTIGLVGLGRIGRALVPRLKGLGLNVLGHDPFADKAWADQAGVKLVSFDELLAASDIVSLHCPVTKETTNLINAQTLAKMKKGSVLINTARGALVDEDALCAALKSGHVAAAGLDAFQVEPLPLSSPLLQCENVLLSPHNAGIDEDSLRDMTCNAAKCLIDLSQGRTPQPEGSVVNTSICSEWKWGAIRKR